MSRRPARHSLCVACGAYLVGGFPSMTSRRTMRAPPIDRIILRSNFTLFLECENLPDHFIAKLAVSRCFAIHDRRSTWSAYHPCLFRPGSFLRPSTPLNTPLTLLLLATASPPFSPSPIPRASSSSFFSHSQLLFRPFSFDLMPSLNDGNHDSGAASSAPMSQASSSRPARALSSRQFSRVFGGAHSRSAPPPPAQESEDPLGTLGAPTARAPLL